MSELWSDARKMQKSTTPGVDCVIHTAARVDSMPCCRTHLAHRLGATVHCSHCMPLTVCDPHICGKLIVCCENVIDCAMHGKGIRTLYAGDMTLGVGILLACQ